MRARKMRMRVDMNTWISNGFGLATEKLNATAGTVLPPPSILIASLRHSRQTEDKLNGVHGGCSECEAPAEALKPFRRQEWERADA